MIQYVEKLGPELQTQTLAEREVLKHAEIQHGHTVPSIVPLPVLPQWFAVRWLRGSAAGKECAKANSLSSTLFSAWLSRRVLTNTTFLDFKNTNCRVYRRIH